MQDFFSFMSHFQDVNLDNCSNEQLEQYFQLFHQYRKSPDSIEGTPLDPNDFFVPRLDPRSRVASSRKSLAQRLRESTFAENAANREKLRKSREGKSSRTDD